MSPQTAGSVQKLSDKLLEIARIVENIESGLSGTEPALIGTPVVDGSRLSTMLSLADSVAERLMRIKVELELKL